MTRLGHLFSPLQVGPMHVRNRLVMAPMERNYAEADGTVSERTIAHYAARATGGVGWIDVESTFVDPVGRGRTHQLGLHADGCVDGFRALAAVAHAGGARIGVELHHAGRNTCSAISGFVPVAPSPVPCDEAGGEVPHELTAAEIDVVVDRYAAAAARAAAAGLDAVELHSAHGYLPLAFLSPLFNHRTDEYGGSPENRMRFAVRVIGALRAAVGDGVAVGCRFSAEEHLEGGLTLEDTVAYALALEAAGADYLSISAGVYASFVRIIPPMDFAEGWMLESAEEIKHAVSIPVIGVSRILDPVMADRAIGAGRVDLVAMGRALLTDPELPRKAREGRLDEIVSCIGCNQGCTSRIADQRDVTCLVNPEVGRELVLRRAPARVARTVVVVGGGPAGMEAARVCAERGHRVTLYERESELGGMLRWAARLPQRGGWVTFLAQARRRLGAAGVTVRLQEAVDAERLERVGADVLVCATGSRFASRGGDSPAVPVLTPPELLAGSAPGHTLVVGAGAIGLGVAAWLAAAGRRATVVAREHAIDDPDGQAGLLARLAGTGKVTLHAEREVIAAAAREVMLARAGAIGPLFGERVRDVDAIVCADARRPVDGVAEIAHESRRFETVVEVGDCYLPRDALAAVYEGAAAAERI